MASLRSTARIARPADEVWKTVSDAAGISAWFPGIEQATAADGTRSCTLAGGHELQEDVVNVDGELRRFQHRTTAGMPVEHHSLAELMGPSIEGGVQGLKAHREGAS